MVEFEHPVGVEFIDLSYLLEKELNRKVDIVSVKGIKSKYLKEIERYIIYVEPKSETTCRRYSGELA